MRSGEYCWFGFETLSIRYLSGATPPVWQPCHSPQYLVDRPATLATLVIFQGDSESEIRISIAALEHTVINRIILTNIMVCRFQLTPVDPEINRKHHV